MRFHRLKSAAGFGLALAWATGVLFAEPARKGASNGSGAESAPNFNRDIAPLFFAHCSECHHAGGTAPFPLVTYQDARKRLRGIVKATAGRTMPPWQPEAGWGHFAGDRRLADSQIDLLRRWAAAGAPEGKAADLPAPPVWNDDWKLGKPDVVVQMQTPFTVPADGSDVYRNFVISTPTAERRYVRAVEFRPGNFRVVHHAFVLVDRTGSARKRDGADGQPGFGGMQPAGAGSPDGHFLSWQPGKRASEEDADSAWVLEPGSEIVIQLHLRPSGKPEPVQASVGLYFTDRPPNRSPEVLLLRSTSIDIPPGERNYAIESSYTLPVDVGVTAVLPHAHYLAREMKAWADLPDGSAVPLLWIKRWNFNWQGDYRYQEPVSLPKGAIIRMRYTYDNSAANPMNPHPQPQRVRYGLDTASEMGELWLQVMPRSAEEHAALRQDFVQNYGLQDALELAQALLRIHPDDAEQHAKLGAVLFRMGKVDEAVSEFKRSVELAPNVDGYFNLSVVYYRQRRVTEARIALRKALEIDPQDYRCLGNMGSMLIETGDVAGAIPYLERAVASNPNDTISRENLARAKAFLSRQER